MSEPSQETSHKSRDGLVFLMLGWFFVIFGLLVWLGLLWPQATEGRIVNGMAGAILLVVGIIAILLGRSSRK